MSDYYKVRATWADGDYQNMQFDTLQAAQRAAARYSRSALRGGPACCAVVYEAGRVYATWNEGKQVRAK